MPLDLWPVYLVMATIALLTIAGFFRAHFLAQRQTVKPNERRKVVAKFVSDATPPHLLALQLSSLLAAEDRQCVDRARYRRFVMDEELAEISADEFRSAINSYLGPTAHTVAPQLALLQEVLAQRELVGPQLWAHQLQDCFDKWALSMEDRSTAVWFMTQITEFEKRLVEEGIIAAGQQVVSVAPFHWAQGVRLARIAAGARRLKPEALQEWLQRASDLVSESGYDLGLVYASVLLPSFVRYDAAVFERRVRLSRELIGAWRERSTG